MANWAQELAMEKCVDLHTLVRMRAYLASS